MYLRRRTDTRRQGSRCEVNWGDWDSHICTAMCKTDSQWEAAVWRTELSLVLCDDPDGWDGGGVGGTSEGRDCCCSVIQSCPNSLWPKDRSHVGLPVLTLLRLPKFMFTALVTLSSHLISDALFFCPQCFSIRTFPNKSHQVTKIWLASVLQWIFQGWSP